MNNQLFWNNWYGFDGNGEFVRKFISKSSSFNSFL
uniref:Uncharacterized protein n=1 Tax=Anguilla anguilla TaxID=7936 RepID=A0A0E9QF43_ANGAN